VLNTAPRAVRSGVDGLATPEQLVDLLARSGFSGRIDGDRAELEAVHEARARLRDLWALERDELAVAVNELLARLGAVPRLERHDGLDWHLHATPQDAPLADRFLVEAGMALLDVVRSDATDRLRTCAADDCDGVLVDLSRNGSKRFCSVRCGNRMNTIAFRARKAAEAGAGGLHRRRAG